MFALLIVLAVVFALSTLSHLLRLARNNMVVTLTPWKIGVELILHTGIGLTLVYALIHWC